jgi:short-subunit dehydrogenase
MTFAAKYGPWALLTGAGRAEGLGFEFANQLAAKGINLILVDALSGYPSFIIMETEPVVREVLDALGKRVRVLPGPVNKSLMFVQSRLMSVKAVVNQLGGFMAKGLGKE